MFSVPAEKVYIIRSCDEEFSSVLVLKQETCLKKNFFLNPNDKKNSFYKPDFKK